MTESEIQKEILSVLNSSDKVDVWRQNVVCRGHVRSVPKGAADISGLLCLSGQRLEIEVKQPGKKQSPDQVEFEARVRAAGGRYLVMRSADDAQEFLAGLPC